MLFYVDPPYWGCEADYGRDLFGREDHARLATALDGLRGRFIVSINDRPETRAIYGRFPCCAVEVTYHRNRDSPQQARELIVSNAFAPGFTVD